MHKLQLLKQMIDTKDPNIELLITDCIEEFSDSKQNKRGRVTSKERICLFMVRVFLGWLLQRLRCDVGFSVDNLFDL